MRAFAAMAVVLVFCSGCIRVGNANRTQFFASHNAKAHLEAVANANGCQVGGGSAGQSIGASTAAKDFEISIKGDASLRDKLMREYKSYVEKELQKSGAMIHGRGVSGDVSGFDFTYGQGRLTGIFRVRAIVDANGYIQVDVFMYEHE
jgi:hypothetical protein